MGVFFCPTSIEMNSKIDCPCRCGSMHNWGGAVLEALDGIVMLFEGRNLSIGWLLVA
jgi:hypothetical protein